MRGQSIPLWAKSGWRFSWGTALVAKLADDLSEEALATTAGSARWYGLAASTTFLLLQKGREVKLKPGEIIEVDVVREGSALPMGAAVP